MNMRFKAILGMFVFVSGWTAGMNASPNPALAAETEMPEITKKVFPSVVRVEVRNAIRKIATGVVCDKDGHIVTTALISPRDEKIYVTTSEGDKFDAEFLGMDSQTHLAVLKVKDKKLRPIEMGEIKNLTAGTWIGVVGIINENDPQVTQGIVSSLGEDTLRLNVWVWKGASGSPVVDKEGRMVGMLRGVYIDEPPVVFEFREKQIVSSGYIVSRAEAPSSGLAIAIPIPVVRDISSEIKEKGKVERGWLGVGLRNLEITEVEKDSPAEEAGLEVGDVILEFGGKVITTGEMLVNEVRKRKPGTTVTMNIERDGKTQKVKVKMGEYTEQDIWKEFELKFPDLFHAPDSDWPARIFPEAPQLFRSPYSKEKYGVWTPLAGRKFIGVTIETLDEDLSAYFGLKDGVGILVRKVEKDSPADKAGLKVGDLIIKADGRRVESNAEFVEVLKDKDKGDTVKLEILRNKKKMTIDVEVMEEEAKISFFRPERWENYVGTWNDYSKEAKKQLNRWKDQYYEEYMETLKKFNQEKKRINEKMFRELKDRSKDATTRFYKTFQMYRDIKV